MDIILTTGSIARAAIAVVAASICAGLGFGLGVWRYRRALQARETALAELDRLRDSRTLLAELRGQGLALQALAAGLDRLERQWTLDLRHGLAPGRQGCAGYELAIRLAQSGASIDELCASCGMTRSEAELVVRLHRNGASRAAARHLAMAG